MNNWLIHAFIKKYCHLILRFRIGKCTQQGLKKSTRLEFHQKLGDLMNYHLDLKSC